MTDHGSVATKDMYGRTATPEKKVISKQAKCFANSNGRFERIAHDLSNKLKLKVGDIIIYLLIYFTVQEEKKVGKLYGLYTSLLQIELEFMTLPG